MLTDMRKMNAEAEVNFTWLRYAVREPLVRRRNKVCTNTQTLLAL